MRPTTLGTHISNQVKLNSKGFNGQLPFIQFVHWDKEMVQAKMVNKQCLDDFYRHFMYK